MRPSGDTARGLVFDDFVDKQVVHVSATSFRSGAERVSMYISVIRLSYLSMFPNMKYWKMITYISHKDTIMTTFWLSDVIREDVIYDRSGVLSDPGGTIDQR